MTPAATPRRAKIVCTIGPATQSTDQLRRLVDAGMDVARLNFSHGSHEDHAAVVDRLRRISRDVGRPVALLQDLQGPKIRIGRLPGGSIQLADQERVRLITGESTDRPGCLATPYAALPDETRSGDAILLSDGLIRLEVQHVSPAGVDTLVIEGGTLRERAGMNLPGAGMSVEALTQKDVGDLAFGLDLGVDYIALSFVRTAADVEDLRQRIRAHGSETAIIAKLEKPQAIENLDAILYAADAVMVARGDLGVEFAPERVPFLQKEIIRRAAMARVPVITATQMLESMVDHPRPTRAETSDVANAILDGTDAVMLSAETAVGDFAIETVQMMRRVIVATEAHASYLPDRGRRRRSDDSASPFADAIADAATGAAADTRARAIVAITQSGFSGRLISKYRPFTPILAFTSDEIVYRRMALLWGVEPRLIPFVESAEEMISSIDALLIADGTTEPGDHLVFIAGTPSTRLGTTNLLKLHSVGD